MSEGVHVISGPGDDAEFLLEIALRDQCVPRKRFAAGHIAIGLQEPSANDIPTPLLYPLLDLRKHRRVGLLHPLIIDGTSGGIVKIIEFDHPIQGASPAGKDLGITVLPTPEPDGINMCISDIMKLFHGILSSLLCFIIAQSNVLLQYFFI